MRWVPGPRRPGGNSLLRQRASRQTRARQVDGGRPIEPPTATEPGWLGSPSLDWSPLGWRPRARCVTDLRHVRIKVKMKKRIGIIDDHPAVMLGVASILNAQPDVQVVVTAPEVPALQLAGNTGVGPEVTGLWQVVVMKLGEVPPLALHDDELTQPESTTLQAVAM